jgi:2-polyprenyl-6-hydroxyphenyl methylase/3-demethylubiquinone-9 3-methyltransferase
MSHPLRWRIAQFFELRWWRRYLGNKPKTDYLSWKKAYWAGFLDKSNIEVSSEARILDAGCGPAGIFILFPNHAVDAVDPLLDAYEANLPHFRRRDYPNVRFFNTALEDFEGKNAAYDLIFCLNAINHVADLETCIKQLTAWSHPKAQLALSVDAHNSQWLKRIFRLAPGDILHPHQHALPDYESLLSAYGWRVQRRILLKKEWIFSYYLLVCER